MSCLGSSATCQVLSTSSICLEARAHIPEWSNQGLCPQAGPSFQLFHGFCPQDKAPRRLQSPTSLSSITSHAFAFPLSHLPLPTSGPLNMPLLLPGIHCVLSFYSPLVDESHSSFKSQHGCRHRELSMPQTSPGLFLIPFLTPPWPSPLD